MKIYFKHTVRYGISIPDKYAKKVEKLIKNNMIQDSTDLVLYLKQKGVNVQGEYDIENAENTQGCYTTTIEVWDNDDNKVMEK